MSCPSRHALGVALSAMVLATVSCTSSTAGSSDPTERSAPAAVEVRSLWVSGDGSDRNPGTPALPLREVDRAADLATPGTVVHVAPGTYAAVTSDRSGRAGAPVTFVSNSRWGASIHASGKTTAWRNSANWVVIQGFDVVGAEYNGILTTGSHGRILGNHVHNMNAPTCTRGGAAIVTESYSASDNDTDGNVVDHIRAPGDCGRVHGIYYQSPHGGRIVNNLVFANSGWGIHLWHNANSIIISNNTVVQNAQGGIAVGGSLEGNDVLPGRASDVVVTNNLVAHNGRAGISELGRVGRNTYIDNLLHGNATVGYLLQSGVPTGTVTSDPRFVDAAAGDFRLLHASPALDVGTALGAPASDIDGAARPNGVWIDIGAFEGGH